MPRINSQDWSVGDDVSAASLQDINDDLDDLYLYGDDRGRVVRAVSGTPLRYDVGAFSWRIGLATGTYAGSTDNVVGDNTTTYVEVDNTGTLSSNTTAFTAAKAPLAIIVTSGGVITSITIRKNDIFGGDLGNNLPTVNVETLSGNKTLDNSSDQIQYLDANATDRTVTLGTTTVLEGRTFYIKNAGTEGDLAVKQSSTTLLTLYPNQSCIATYDGTDWHVMLHVSDARFGDGRDGVLNVTSGTTTIDCTGHVNGILIKQYVSFNVSVGATLDFSNVPSQGITFIVLCQGNFTCAGTINGAGGGSAGGAGVTVSISSNTSSSVVGNNGTNCDQSISLGQDRFGGAGGVSTTGGTGNQAMVTANAGGGPANSIVDGTTNGGTAGVSLTLELLKIMANAEGQITLSPGCGGGSGGVAVKLQNAYSSGSSAATSRDGGRGGMSIMVWCGGNFSMTGTVDLSGVAVSGSATSSLASLTGANRGAASGAGGSSGGASGCFAGFVKGTIDYSGTWTLNGGAGINGSASQSGSGDGSGSLATVTNGVTGAAGRKAITKIW